MSQVNIEVNKHPRKRLQTMKIATTRPSAAGEGVGLAGAV